MKQNQIESGKPGTIIRCQNGIKQFRIQVSWTVRILNKSFAIMMSKKMKTILYKAKDFHTIALKIKVQLHLPLFFKFSEFSHFLKHIFHIIHTTAVVPNSTYLQSSLPTLVKHTCLQPNYQVLLHIFINWFCCV